MQPVDLSLHFQPEGSEALPYLRNDALYSIRHWTFAAVRVPNNPADLVYENVLQVGGRRVGGGIAATTVAMRGYDGEGQSVSTDDFASTPNVLLVHHTWRQDKPNVLGIQGNLFGASSVKRIAREVQSVLSWLSRKSMSDHNTPVKSVHLPDAWAEFWLRGREDSGEFGVWLSENKTSETCKIAQTAWEALESISDDDQQPITSIALHFPHSAGPRFRLETPINGASKPLHGEVHADTRLEDSFAIELGELCKRIKTEGHYSPTFLMRMIKKHGALGAVRRLLDVNKVSTGFQALVEREKSHLTLEAFVLHGRKFHSLFTPEQLERARTRLRDEGQVP